MYKLKARFSTLDETPTHPLSAFGLKMQESKKVREIYFEDLPSREELSKSVQNHYKKYGGKIDGFGEIKSYEFYEDNNLLYKLDLLGNIVENEKFLDLMIEFYFGYYSDKTKELLKIEFKYLEEFEEDYIELFNRIKEIVNEVDPFGIAYIDNNDDEYEPEIRDLTIRLIGRSLNKAKIFKKKTKAVFEEWFFIAEENVEKYWLIADKIFEFYIEKKEKRSLEKTFK